MLRSFFYGQKKEHCSTLRALTLIKRGKYMIILLNHTVAENLSNDFMNSGSQIGVSPFPTGTESSSPICKLEFTKSSFPHRYRAILFVLSIRQILTKDNFLSLVGEYSFQFVQSTAQNQIFLSGSFVESIQHLVLNFCKGFRTFFLKYCCRLKK